MKIGEALSYLKWGVAENFMEGAKMTGNYVLYDGAIKILALRKRVYQVVVLTLMETAIAAYVYSRYSPLDEKENSLGNNPRHKKLLTVAAVFSTTGVVVGVCDIAIHLHRLSKVY